jgi:hypothetical protein
VRFAHRGDFCKWDGKMNQPYSGFPVGNVRLLLQLEGAAVLAVAALMFYRSAEPWWIFAALFLAPDLSMIAYLAGARAGAIIYNAAHTYLLPLMLWVFGTPDMQPFALIWIAHIGFDRTMRYGLKYTSGFQDTHLGRIGKSAPQARAHT